MKIIVNFIKKDLSLEIKSQDLWFSSDMPYKLYAEDFMSNQPHWGTLM